MTILYNCCGSEPNHHEFIITKFDDSFEVESSYTTSLSSCECPQFTGRGKECRHIKMLGLFINSEHIDDNYFLEYETGCFHRIGQDEPALEAEEPNHEPSEHGLGPKAPSVGLQPQALGLQPAEPELPLPPASVPTGRRRVV